MASIPRGKADYHAPGDWNAVCFVCGQKFKASMLIKHWQGYYVCKDDWEMRHPQDFVKGVPDNQTPPWTQPPPAEVFAPVCMPEGLTAYPSYAIPGCVKPSFVSPFLIYAQVSGVTNA